MSGRDPGQKLTREIAGPADLGEQRVRVWLACDAGCRDLFVGELRGEKFGVIDAAPNVG